MKKYSFALVLLLNLLHKTAAQQGLKGEYFDGTNFDRFVATRTDAKIDFEWFGTPPISGMKPQYCSIRWTGKLRAPKTGVYVFSARVDDGIRLWVDNKPMIDAWDLHDEGNFSNKITLQAGQMYDLKVEYFNAMREGQITLLWQIPDETDSYFGLFGKNFKPIGSQYFSQPMPNLPVKPNVLPPKPLVAQPKQAATKPATPLSNFPKTEAKPIKKIAPKPIQKPLVNLDTVSKYTAQNILFEKSKPVMLSESFVELDNLADMLRRFPRKTIIVEGHTDNVGDAVLNQKLSEERANTVADYLIKKGIAAARISWKGYGSSRPLPNNDGQKFHERNRRVEFIIQ